MKILWFTWKDRKNPQAGGAELVNEELAKRAVLDGHEVIFVVAGFNGGSHEEWVDGYKVIRVGNRWTVYLKAYQYYKKHLVGWADIVIEEINTIPFMTQWYVKEKKILFIYQLCREIWFYQLKIPLNVIGFFLEPVFLYSLRKNIALTESESTRNDLIKYGFMDRNIYIIPIGIEMECIDNVDEVVKYKQPTLLSIGMIRKMKRTDHVIKAFEIAKAYIPKLQLIIAGSAAGRYGKKVLKMIGTSPYTMDIKYKGFVSESQKIELMQKSHFICVTSVKEGWGLIITEANSQGTPAIVYNVDGLRDSVRDGETGFVTSSNPESLSEAIVEAFLNRDYRNFQQKALEHSRDYSFIKSYQKFMSVLRLHIGVY